MFFGKTNDYSKVDSIIGAEAEIKGNIVSRASMRIDGKVEGDVSCDGDLIIGKEGKIKGDIKGKSIIISGKVLGNAEAVERIEIHELGQLVGDLRSALVVIAEGAMFEGHCEMTAAKANIVELPEKEHRARARASE